MIEERVARLLTGDMGFSILCLAESSSFLLNCTLCSFQLKINDDIESGVFFVQFDILFSFVMAMGVLYVTCD